MGKRTDIEWADHTFNPWWGCEKVSPACDNCYAEAWDKRLPGGADRHWGKDAPRRQMGETHWNAPRSWNRSAKERNVVERVFTASMADVAEDRRDLDGHRKRLGDLISETPNLQWMLLTKRPENLVRLFDPAVLGICWVGTTAEDQAHAEKRIPYLLEVPARRRFISAEPLLGPLDLRHLDAERAGHEWMIFVDALSGRQTDMGRRCPDVPRLDWVIAGGESGAMARPSSLEWFRSLRDQCGAAGVPFFFKQHGEHVGAARVGKRKAGRELDGRTWDEVPDPYFISGDFRRSDPRETIS